MKNIFLKQPMFFDDLMIYIREIIYELWIKKYSNKRKNKTLSVTLEFQYSKYFLIKERNIYLFSKINL